MISFLCRMVEFRPCSEIFNFAHKWHRIEIFQILEHSVSRSIMCPQSSIRFGEKNISAQGRGQSFVLFSCGKKAPVLVSKNTEERLFVVDSGASMHMLSKKDLTSDDMDTLRRSRTSNGKVQTNEEAQVYVYDLDLFLTVQLLDETQAVLSLGKLCSEHGRSYAWKNGETQRLTKNGKTITCAMDNFAPLVVPGLSSSSSSSSASTSRPKVQSTSFGKSETSSDPMTTPRAKHACGKPMQTNPDKQASGSRGSAHTEDETDKGSNARHSGLVTVI